LLALKGEGRFIFGICLPNGIHQRLTKLRQHLRVIGVSLMLHKIVDNGCFAGLLGIIIKKIGSLPMLPPLILSEALLLPQVRVK